MKKFIRQLALCLAVLISLCGVWTFAAMAESALMISTTILPNAVAGEAYTAKVFCNDSTAVFTIAGNAGKFTDFGKTGLTLGEDGTISGTPTEAGVYRFCILATGDTGADYRVYTLVVSGTSTAKPTEPQPEVTVTQPVTTEPATEPVPTEPITEPATTEPTTQLTTTEPTTQPVTTTQAAPTEASPIDPLTSQPTEVKSKGFPWWTVILAAVGIGAGVGIVVVKQKKE